MSNRIWRQGRLKGLGVLASVLTIAMTSPASANAVLRRMAAVTNSDPIVAAAGDIACDPRSDSFQGRGPAGCGMNKTEALLGRIHLEAQLTLGDNQYVCGAFDAIERSFAATWGRFAQILHPSPGDHEYMTQ